MLDSMQPRADRGEADPTDPFAGPVQLTSAGVPLPVAEQERTNAAAAGNGADEPGAFAQSEPPLLEETQSDANPLRGPVTPLASNEASGRPDVFGDESTAAGSPDSIEERPAPLPGTIDQAADEVSEPDRGSP